LPKGENPEKWEKGGGTKILHGQPRSGRWRDVIAGSSGVRKLFLRGYIGTATGYRRGELHTVWILNGGTVHASRK